MGYSLGWVAVRGSDAGAVHRILGVTGTGVRQELRESPVVGASLAGGWYVVIVDRGEHLLEDALLAKLSDGCEAVGCFVEEHVMYSAAVGWAHGRRLWSVTHDSEQARAHLEILGDPPPAIAAIRARLEAEQDAAGGDEADVDFIFEIPAETAKAVTGFRHDEDVEAAEAPPFEVLARETAPESRGEGPRGWWQKRR